MVKGYRWVPELPGSGTQGYLIFIIVYFKVEMVVLSGFTLLGLL